MNLKVVRNWLKKAMIDIIIALQELLGKRFEQEKVMSMKLILQTQISLTIFINLKRFERGLLFQSEMENMYIL